MSRKMGCVGPRKHASTQPLSSSDCAFSLCKVWKAYWISLVDKAAQMCARECACMCACIQLWALKQAWIHTSTSSLGFECDPCEIEREGARAEGWLTLLPPLLAVAWGWFPDDVKQCSKSSAPPQHTHTYSVSPLSSLPSQTSSLALLFAPSHCQLEFSSDCHTLLIKTYIWKLSEAFLNYTGRLVPIMPSISSGDISDYNLEINVVDISWHWRLQARTLLSSFLMFQPRVAL